MGCGKMSNMEFLDHEEAEKFNKQKREQFWWTPCSLINVNPLENALVVRWACWCLPPF